MIRRHQNQTVSVVLIFMLYAILVVGICLLPGKIPYEMVKENGPVETLSVGGYFLFCLFIAYFNFIGIVRTGFAPGFFAFLLGLRELDFHERFTTMGIFKIKFYLSPEVPVVEKSIASIFIVAVLAYGYIYLRRYFSLFKKHVFAGKPYAVSILCAVGCILVSKFFDSNSEIFIVFSNIYGDTDTLGRISEECLELFIPVFLVRALIQYCEDSLREDSQVKEQARTE